MIARLERGDDQRIPKFETIFRLLKVLGYSISKSPPGTPYARLGFGGLD
jgi:hypothetical protein